MNDEKITQEQVEARIADWVNRVGDLYQTIKEWVRPIEGLRVEEHQNVTMYEEPMQRFSLSPQPMSTLDLYDGDVLIARVKPIGIWVIGANGRVDLFLRQGAVQLVDESERLQAAKWIAHDREHFTDGQLLTRDYFLQTLGVQQHDHV